MSIKFEHKHGEARTFEVNHPRVQEIVHKMVNMQNSAALCLHVALTNTAIVNGKRMWHIPCRQCMLDTALEFKDIGTLIDELMDMK